MGLRSCFDLGVNRFGCEVFISVFTPMSEVVWFVVVGGDLSVYGSQKTHLGSHKTKQIGDQSDNKL
jgi:hypothetical protein